MGLRELLLTLSNICLREDSNFLMAQNEITKKLSKTLKLKGALVKCAPVAV